MGLFLLVTQAAQAAQAQSDSTDWKPWFYVALGIFLILGSMFDWDFLLNSRRAQRVNKHLDRSGTRSVLMVVGVIVTMFALLTAFDI